MEYVPETPGISSSLHFLKNESFKEAFDPSNEQFTFDFLIQRVEESLSHLKPKDHYLNKQVILEKEITYLNDFHMLNVMRLHLDEHDILTGNLEYLRKARDENIRVFYWV
jgi:hypothetical protein